MTDPTPKKDRVLRAVTHDGNFRVMAAQTTETARAIIQAQAIPASMARTVAEIATATILVRECMAPDLRMQAIVQSKSRGLRLVVDSFPDGTTRALLTVKNAEETLVGPGTVLQIQRTLHNGALHQGIVAYPEPNASDEPAVGPRFDIRGAPHPVAALYMHYMQESEQIVTMMSVGGLESDGQLSECGGFVVQLLPEVERGKLAVMAERLEDFRDMVPLLAKGVGSPETLLIETLWGMPNDQVAERPVQYGCNCSRERVLSGLASLPMGDIEELATGVEPLEIQCEFCRTTYSFPPADLRGLLTAN
jgi:molecular chaperone Hsp33